MKKTIFQIGSRIHEKVSSATFSYQENVADNFSELKVACVLKCDLSSIPLHEFERATNPKTKKTFYIADLICRMELAGSEVVVKILYHETLLSKATIKDIGHSSSISSWR